MPNSNDYADDHLTAADQADDDLDTWADWDADEEDEKRTQAELEAFWDREEELARIFDNSRFNI